jgi:ABC-type amino acid transport substrate-binding protein
MRRASPLACALAVAAALGSAAPIRAGEPLRVCLQAHDPPLSSRGNGAGSGADVALSRTLAERLGRPLAIQWFVTRRDPDSNPASEANALLSDARCELVAGYALIADALGHPRAATAKLPPFDGATPDDRHRWIRLGELMASRPYRFDALSVVLSPGHADLRIHKLADLADLSLGVEIHSLPDLIAMSYAAGRLDEHVVHFPDARALFAQLEDDSLDAGFVDLHQFDAWRLEHPGTRVAASGYTHSIGFNIGFVGLSTNQALIKEVDPVLSDLMSSGEVSRIAGAAGVTYLPPRSPAVAPGVSLAALSGD